MERLSPHPEMQLPPISEAEITPEAVDELANQLLTASPEDLQGAPVEPEIPEEVVAMAKEDAINRIDWDQVAQQWYDSVPDPSGGAEEAIVNPKEVEIHPIGKREVHEHDIIASAVRIARKEFTRMRTEFDTPDFGLLP